MDGANRDFEAWRAQGDAAALGRVFDVQAPKLLRFGVHLVGDASAAEDLVQETFLTALRLAVRYDAERPLDRWLAGILVRHAQELHREARRRSPEPLPERWSERTPLDDARSAEEHEAITRALDRLEEPYRSAAVLHLSHGLSPAEIAHALDRSPGAVRVQLHRAREMLRNSLPAGIAGALALLAEPARGLESIRSSVLEHAVELAPAAGGVGGVLGGALVMKKVSVAATIVLAVLVAVWWTGAGNNSRARDETDTVSIEAARPDAASSDPVEVASTPNAIDARTPGVGSTAAPAGPTQSFRCRVIDGVSGLPLAGARVRFFAPKSSLLSEVRDRWPDRFIDSTRGFSRPRDWPWFAAPFSVEQQLELEPVLSYEAPAPSDSPLAQSTCDADGAVEVTLPAQLAFVVAEYPGYESRGVPPALERTHNYAGVDGKSGQKTFRDEVLLVRLFRPQILKGQLIDPEGEPLARRVALRFEGSAAGDLIEGIGKIPSPVDSWTAWTNPDGSFALEVAAKSISIRSLDPAWSVISRALDPVTKKPGGFALGCDPGLDELAWVPLVPSLNVVVRSAEDAQPVRDYWIQVHTIPARWPRGPLRRIRSMEGQARVVDVDDIVGTPGSEPLGIHVFAEGYLPAVAECATPRAGGTIELELHPGTGPRIEGRVTDAGRALVGAAVVLAPSDKSNWDCVSPFAGHAVRTDEQGRFSLLAAPGTWVVSVAHSGRQQCRLVENPGTTPLAIDLAQDTAIEVVVDAPAGTRFDDVHAMVHSPPSVIQSQPIDEHGRARFGSLPQGRYEIMVRGPTTTFHAAPGEAQLELLPGTTRTVRFGLESGDPVRMARLVVDGVTALDGWKASEYGSSSTHAVEPDGRIPIDVGWKPLTLLIENPSGQSFRFAVPFESAGEPILRVPLQRGGYSGVLRRAGGAPLRGRRVVATFAPDEHGLDWVMSTTDSEGRFQLPALPARARLLQLLSSGSNTAVDGFDNLNFECAPPPALTGRELSIELPAAADWRGVSPSRIALSGFVRASGSPAGGAYLWLQGALEQSEGTLWVGTSTNVLSDGSYSISTIPAPRHVAHIRLMGTSASIDRELVIPSGGAEAREDIELP